MSGPPTPVILVTGYAAAGKNFLVNNLLARASQRGLAVGVIAHRQAEEYGIAPSDIDQACAAYFNVVYDFGSGCICCSPKGDLTRMLADLAAVRDDAAQRLDLLILRLGSLASPLIFAKAICTNEELMEHYELASITAVVNTTLALRHLGADSLEWQAVAQVACADLVLLNTHRAFGTPDADVNAVVSAQNPHAPVQPMPSAAAELDALVARRGFSRADASRIDPEFSISLDEAPAIVVSLTAHDRRLAACCAVEDGALYWAPLRTLCQQLVASGSVLRMKGVVQLLENADAEGLIEATEDGATESTWVLIEAVEDLLTFRRAHPPGARPRADANEDEAGGAPPPASKLFVLGRQLQVATLRRDFQACRVPPGFAFAADTQLHFGRRRMLTAASTTTAGLPPSPTAVPSDLPGVIVLRVCGASDAADEGEYTAIATPPGYDSDEAFCAAVAAGRVTVDDTGAMPRLRATVIAGAIYVRTKP